jgi:outer membrane protein OmpA-like peptidoglycan-associated protein
VSVITDIIVVESTKPFDEMCEKAFAHIPVSPISFRKSSTEIPKASFATLDRITDFAHDCQRATISIAGHSDASGDESWNRQLSLARAQAVADHLVRSGIAPERLLVNGLGSAEPVADNTTAHGRSLNRRIDFELD